MALNLGRIIECVSSCDFELFCSGSDDARGPILPSSALGSRKDPPPIGGIYAKHKALSSVPGGESLPPIQEKSILVWFRFGLTFCSFLGQVAGGGVLRKAKWS